MPRTIYLEAAARTQDVLTAKWILRSCGYVIASTWHDEPILRASKVRSGRGAQWLKQAEGCDTLLIIRGQDEELPPELPFMVGFAAARNCNVVWVGAAIDLPGCSRSIQYFATLDDFQKHLLLESDSLGRRSAGDLFAA